MAEAKFSPTDYLTLLDRFITLGDVFEFETSVQMDFPRAIKKDPILEYLQHLDYLEHLRIHLHRYNH